MKISQRQNVGVFMDNLMTQRLVRSSQFTVVAEKSPCAGRSHSGDSGDLEKLSSDGHERYGLSANADCQSQELKAESLGIGECGTMLLVDDDQLLRELVKSVLSSQGFTVLEAHDGLKAVDMFRKHQDRIRFVLCDVIMPHMDGWETLAILRQIAPGFPVILSSACDQVQVTAGDHSERPQVFLKKPYGILELRKAIREALKTEVLSDCI
jgi:CheY-like chemotaxis protein